MTIDLETLAENNEKRKIEFGAGFNPHSYNPLIFDDHVKEYMTPLVDWKRALKVTEHWNPIIQRMEICDLDQGKEECESCKKAKKKDSGFRTSEFKKFPVYVYSRVGKTRPSANGEVYDVDPIMIYKLRPGENDVNFKHWKRMNGDPDRYYS